MKYLKVENVQKEFIGFSMTRDKGFWWGVSYLVTYLTLETSLLGNDSICLSGCLVLADGI